jgi:hypothetical protein
VHGELPDAVMTDWKERPMSNGRAVVLLALMVMGCTGPAAAPSSPAATTATPPAAASSPSASGAATIPPAPAGEMPPAASLAAEGGDPVVGQLGTYVWHEGGSDSPWLRGAKIAVGAGEPLSVTLDPGIGIASWSARSVSATADGPAGATTLGRGTAMPAFGAPAPGAWTVEVRVVFADDLGSASYFWRLDVS